MKSRWGGGRGERRGRREAWWSSGRTQQSQKSSTSLLAGPTERVERVVLCQLSANFPFFPLPLTNRARTLAIRSCHIVEPPLALLAPAAPSCLSRDPFRRPQGCATSSTLRAKSAFRQRCAVCSATALSGHSAQQGCTPSWRREERQEQSRRRRYSRLRSMAAAGSYSWTSSEISKLDPTSAACSLFRSLWPQR
ncbi:hypothetical protein AAT19DRAFT_11071 [Rhodotorula toruloides]|uniref:Uncharacterized protein n=1 Tax=Rhodotorula toruloides TaxID=5286 RepID=A0A2S9ZX45_RHOTO|nr:hypothetical protein AAT19DRAFT_11071 [Rhodotorula toruloides]